MATMITSECINCGACEPECPNNAISQSEELYVIDPLLCTECVGFHDYEACAAVCPVDCCVTDPNNVETEEALIGRAKAIHQDVQFGDTFESRFRKGDKPAPAAAKKPAAQPQAEAAASTAPAEHAATAAVETLEDAETIGPPLPPADSWSIPLRCYKCNESFDFPVGRFMVGNVLWCPHCHKSMVVRDNVNYQIRTLLKDFYEGWEKHETEFRARRERELREFREKRAKELREFENRRRQDLEKIKARFADLGENYDAPGRPAKKGTSFGWG